MRTIRKLIIVIPYFASVTRFLTGNSKKVNYGVTWICLVLIHDDMPGIILHIRWFLVLSMHYEKNYDEGWREGGAGSGVLLGITVWHDNRCVKPLFDAYTTTELYVLILQRNFIICSYCIRQYYQLSKGLAKMKKFATKLLLAYVIVGFGETRSSSPAVILN